VGRNSKLMDVLDEYYWVAPGVDIVPLDEETLLLRSDTVALRIEGNLARFLRDFVFPQLDGSKTLRQIAAGLSDSAQDELKARLDGLVNAQVLRADAQPRQVLSLASQLTAPFDQFLHAVGISVDEARAILRESEVSIIGLEGQGGHIAALLGQFGIGKFVLVDPFPCHAGNLTLMPFGNPTDIGRPRQTVISEGIQVRHPDAKIALAGPELNRSGLEQLVSNSNMIVSCFDKGYAASHHWVNQASLEYNIPALYTEVKAHLAFVGPMVIPDQTACYMCYRMRSIANANDFEEAITYEEYLDHTKSPALHERAALPTMPSFIANLAALEIVKHLLSITSSGLSGRVLEFDALTLETQFHPILQKPDCPVCSLKKNTARKQLSLAEITANTDEPGDLMRALPFLVSSRTGIIRAIQQFQKDISEPRTPYIFGAELSNHRFLTQPEDQHEHCSGKGYTLESAHLSVLGEAVERYSGSCWNIQEVLFASRDELDGESLDPAELVLFRDQQYSGIRYSPYTGTNRLGWIKARSLIDGRLVYVPALAVFMNYEVQRPEEFLFPVTSNGLACGATLADAICAAALEVIERDAFMITWLNRLPSQRLRWDTLPDTEALQLCHAYRRRGVELILLRLTTDHPFHVFCAIGVQTNKPNEPAAVVGLGADMFASRAASRAISEVGQVRPALRKRFRGAEGQQRAELLLEDPHRVESLDDHDLLYATQHALPFLGFLTDQSVQECQWDVIESLQAEVKLARLVEYFQSQKQELLYYNLTPPDMADLRLYTVRVIIPGYQPIDFGWNERRLGGKRLYRLPWTLNLATAPTTFEQLNDYPHPLA
jgi:ribosomal protein S12 methylthiotransferase accessory factor